MLDLLNSLPMNGQKAWVSIAIYALALGLFQLGYIDQHMLDVVKEWDTVFFGVAITHKVAKLSTAE